MDTNLSPADALAILLSNLHARDILISQDDIGGLSHLQEQNLKSQDLSKHVSTMTIF